MTSHSKTMFYRIEQTDSTRNENWYRTGGLPYTDSQRACEQSDSLEDFYGTAVHYRVVDDNGNVLYYSYQPFDMELGKKG